MKMKGIKDKNVLITGSSRGIGQAIAIAFASYGANIVINYRSNKVAANDTRKRVEKHNVKAITIQADVGKESDIKHLITKSVEQLGSVDILVNNAAIQSEAASHQRDTNTFDRTIATNLRGPFMLCKYTIQHFLDRGYPGVIINISSPHEVIPKPGFIDYAISKGGLRNLTTTLALEYSDRNIRVNSVAPGAVKTDINKAWLNDPGKKKEVESHIPLGYAAEPEQIAPSVVFLASDDASYITGITLFVDGGAMLFPEYRENWSS